MEGNIIPEDTPSKKCIACKAIIDAQASLCSVCSSYQKNWKNLLRYWVNAAGITTIIISLITYLWSAIPNAFFDDSVAILSFDDNRITVSNEGYGLIYISHAVIESEDDSFDIGLLRQIAIPLEVGEIKRLNIEPYKNIPKGASLGFVNACSDEEWKIYFDRSQNRSDNCYFPGFYLKNGATISKIKAEQKNIRMFGGNGILTFYSNRKRAFMEKQFELSGVIFKNNSEDCFATKNSD